MDELLQRAQRAGIETQYWDAFGRLRHVAPAVISRIADVLAAGENRRILPRTIVVRGQVPHEIHLIGTEGLPLHWEIVSDQKIAEGEANSPVFALPPGLPIGIFRLRVTHNASPDREREESTLIVCSHATYQGSSTWPQRMWALSVQLYAVRSHRNWGHGDFSDLLELIDLAADLGASGVGLNPLHALFDDKAEEPSPYYPNSRLFLNPLYIDLGAVEEFPGCDAAGMQDDIARLRACTIIDYPVVAEIKWRALRLAHETFQSAAAPERRRLFEQFRHNDSSRLNRFACFEFLRRKFGKPWWEWPQEYRAPDEGALKRLRRDEERAIEFFEFVQWLAHSQLDQCRVRAQRMPIGLYLDIAVGVRSDGFDAWCDQDAVLAGMAIGAPPDQLNTGGQNWGLAGFKPSGLERREFEPFRRLLRAAMQYAGAVRIDHVLGLQRLYLIPHGVPASEGTYMRLPFNALLALIALASAENTCVVIGEDLGTVPENFRETLADWGIWSYQVMLFERSADGAFTPPASYREKALVTFGTHDTATFAGWRDHHDLKVKRALNIDPGESDDDRRRARDALRHALSEHGIHATDFASIARYLADAPSRLLVISVEDILGVKDQVNLPGTLNEHPNWRQPLPIMVEEMRNQRALTLISDAMRLAGRSCG
jgi:4-alpha-glucanotransferase